MDAAISFRHYALVFKKICQSIKRYISTRIFFKHLVDKRGILLMDADSFGTRVVDVTDRGEAGVDTLPRFLAQTASGIRRELPDILVRHSQFNGHHQNIVVRIVRAVVRLDVANDALLQKPLHLPAVHGIAREAIYFPTNDSLCLAALNTRHHIAKDGAAGLLRTFLFYKFLCNLQIIFSREQAQLCELCFNGQNLFVFNISAFASIEKIPHGFIVSHFVGAITIVL